ncbi:hypothetical protein ACIG53_02445 [Streptomyces bauhiniae]|uniref:hypothetical protein n=1 Tax=Streptomyces bauhiniae TaxID=2340725 RepID=UPI0037D64E0F
MVAVTPLPEVVARYGARRLLLAAFVTLVGSLTIAGVLTHKIEPEAGTAIGSIAAATIAVVAYILRVPSPRRS